MQSLMIDDYGVTELFSSEMQDIDGGMFIFMLWGFLDGFIKGIL